MEQFRIHSFHSFNSSTTSSGTGEYGSIPERPSKNEEQISWIKEWTRHTPSSGPNILQMKRSKLT